jgi:hypothetical protein
VRGDPYWLTAKFSSACSNPLCQRTIKKGEQVFYYPKTCRVLCNMEPCGKTASRDFEAAVFDEEFGYR